MGISKNARVGKEGYAETQDCLPKHNYGSGAGFCLKREKKRSQHGKGQTPGSTKSATCQASTMDRHMAKCSRSYKHRDYRAWMKKTDLKRRFDV